MTSPDTQAVAPRLSRRAALASLAGGVAGLALLQADPVAALARGAAHTTNAAYTRGQTLYTYKEMPYGVLTIDWSPDGKQIVTTGDGGPNLGYEQCAQIWDALTGQSLLVFDDEGYAELQSSKWSPDGTRIASGNYLRGAKIWDVTSGQTLATYTGHNAPFVVRVEWASDSRRVASFAFTPHQLDADNSVHVWDPATGERLLIYSGHTADIGGLAWSPDGRSLASGSLDTTVQVWDSSSGEHILTYTGHTSSVNTVAWSPDGTRIASGSDDATVQIWDPFTGQGYLTYRGHISGVNAVDWSPNGKLLASGSGDRSVQIWSPDSPKTLFYYYGNGADGLVVNVAWSPGGQLIADCTQTDFLPTQAQALVWVGN